jgi:hypothetical protein
VLAGFQDGSVRLFAIQDEFSNYTLSIMMAFKPHGSMVLDLCFNRKFLATCGMDGVVFIFNCDELNQADETGSTQFTVQGPSGKEISSCRNGITYCQRTRSWIKEIVLPKIFSQQTSSSSTTNTFAKFQIVDPLKPIIYNESSDIHNESYFTPPISKLDRLHLVLRTHDQKSTSVSSYGITAEPGFIYSSGGTFTTSGLEYGLSLELDIVENAFDDFSTLETRVSERSTDFFS